MQVFKPCRAFLRKFVISGIAVIGIGSLLATSGLHLAHASQNPNAKRTKCDTMVIGGPSGAQPVSYIAQDGEQTGIGVDILKEYAKRHGITVKVDLDMPFPRMMTLLKSGEIDVAAGVYYKTERQWVYRFSAPYYKDEIVVFQRNDHRFAYNHISDLRVHRGARPKGGSLGNMIDAYTKDHLDMVFAPTADNIFDLLINGRVDYILLGRTDGAATLHDLGLDHLVSVAEPPVARNNVHLLFSRNSPCLTQVEQINLLIEELTQQGVIAQFTQHHLQQTMMQNASAN